MSVAAVNASCSCGKVVYVSRREALTSAKRMKNVTSQQRPYRCPAGHWHLTSRTNQSKKHLPEGSKDEDAVSKARARRAEKRAAERRLANARVEPVVKLEKPAPRLTVVHVKPRPKGPERTSCTVCERRWLSDLDPTNRRCPGCGQVGTIVIGWADRDRNYVRSVAA